VNPLGVDSGEGVGKNTMGRKGGWKRR